MKIDIARAVLLILAGLTLIIAGLMPQPQPEPQRRDWRYATAEEETAYEHKQLSDLLKAQQEANR
ncbi:hypothetical protein V6U89_21385 [Micromonospora sp. CPCC 206171]|uniref:hypothetical protein n=1 Tax=Micromonospora sp. CPCC 206171 TaxID=3122405 RepID=UPI002FF22484